VLRHGKAVDCAERTGPFWACPQPSHTLSLRLENAGAFPTQPTGAAYPAIIIGVS